MSASCCPIYFMVQIIESSFKMSTLRETPWSQRQKPRWSAPLPLKSSGTQTHAYNQDVREAGGQEWMHMNSVLWGTWICRKLTLSAIKWLPFSSIGSVFLLFSSLPFPFLSSSFPSFLSLSLLSFLPSFLASFPSFSSFKPLLPPQKPIACSSETS